ncbi:TetR/AcrR family transcriptional regulator [Brachybacterium hainanense]|uniref:TetR/AcrR family transcriptional regulator n=1 Tax=Brachybacterium hainanense TaxID=1541174 RepID=A0ABV6RFZ5_9MICO
MSDPDAGPRTRPGGRSARVRAALFEATLAELVENGYAALSISTVAARAGVHRTSVYRRWPDRDALLEAALASLTAEPVRPEDTGALETDLRRYAEGIITVLNGPAGTVLQALLSSDARSLPQADRLRQALLSSRRALSAQMLARAVQRGEIPATTVADDVVDLLVAPLYFRLLLTGEALDDALAARTARAAAAAARAGALTAQTD